MIQEYARIARPYFVLLSIVAVGRFLMGTAFGVPYEKGTHVLSIVTLTLFASLFTAALTRRWLGYRLVQAAGLTMFMALVSQLVILAFTAGSYALGMATYYNAPTALNQTAEVAAGQALGLRLGGLVVNTILNGIAGALGWALGALLPARERSAAS
jgi:hypothetical protein